jgi:hypothetical protein
VCEGRTGRQSQDCQGAWCHGSTRTPRPRRRRDRIGGLFAAVHMAVCGTSPTPSHVWRSVAMAGGCGKNKASRLAARWPALVSLLKDADWAELPLLGLRWRTLKGLSNPRARPSPTRRRSTATREEIWFADEARIGQKNKITRRWAKRGTRPSAPRDQRTASTYLFGAVCPKSVKGQL